MLIHLCIAYGCSHVVTVELSSCNRDSVACRVCYCLALYRKSLLSWFKQLFKFIHIFDRLPCTLLVFMCSVENPHIGWHVIP